MLIGFVLRLQLPGARPPRTRAPQNPRHIKWDAIDLFGLLQQSPTHEHQLWWPLIHLVTTQQLISGGNHCSFYWSIISYPGSDQQRRRLNKNRMGYKIYPPLLSYLKHRYLKKIYYKSQNPLLSVLRLRKCCRWLGLRRHLKTAYMSDNVQKKCNLFYFLQKNRKNKLWTAIINVELQIRLKLYDIKTAPKRKGHHSSHIVKRLVLGLSLDLWKRQ